MDQPQATAMAGTTKGAIMAPTLEPQLKRPVARARSFLGNHSATVAMAAGKLAASERPRKIRQMQKAKTVVRMVWPKRFMVEWGSMRATRPWAREARVQATT